ncbi:uncharacterized protein LOC112183751 isoform X3 [Rosa chinensis]|uniref:uncharacterized protein LOC112183751 isoform X3 n=1 Tax=Rosa chinensis TaxID=74649 RepID=UPI000D08A37E|nr:uncharacterized protein LOC112183751 isoform X3 [Rosa chinensis]
MSRSRVDAILSMFVTVHPHETSALLHSSASFFFILCAYFVVLPLRDEGAISLGLSNLPSLFIGSLLLTSVAAPLATLFFSLPNVPKGKIALLNLITISSTWARVIDVMDSESGSRLFGFIGAGATLGQLCGSLFATGMAFLGPFLLLFSALLMEFAAQSSKGITQDVPHLHEELTPIRTCKLGSGTLFHAKTKHTVQTRPRILSATILKAEPDQQNEPDGQTVQNIKGVSPKSSTPVVKPRLWAILDGFRLILSSSYLLYVSLFLWLSAVVSSFFYFQKVSVIAMTVTSSLGRRKLLAQINSFIAIFILAGQLTITGHFLTVVGVTTAICSAPVVAFLNLVATAIWPTWVAIAISETLRKFVTYVVARPGRELLFTVVSQDEKYKAKVCIDVFVQRLGDATAAGMYKLLFSTLNGRASTVSLYGLPVCLLWIVIAFHLGRRQAELARVRTHSTS